MIISDMRNWDQEKEVFSPAIQKGVDYLRNTDVQHMEPGKYEIDGEDMFVLIQEVETRVKSERQFESHIKYVDIQYVISGEEEIIGFARQHDGQVIAVNEFDTKDIALYDQVEGDMDLHLKPGMFAIFFPSDLHRPICSTTGNTKIKKAVIKINKALLLG
jgi:biofilm protein TabA